MRNDVFLAIALIAFFSAGVRGTQSGWNIDRYDLTNSSYYPFPSTQLVQGNRLLLKYAVAGSRVRTGDVDGDGQLEIVTSGEGHLNVYSGDGQLKWRRSIWGNLDILADVTGDGIPEIIVSAKYDSVGCLECYSGSSSSEPVKIFSTFLNPSYGTIIARGVMDFNGDGMAELLAVKSTPWTSPRGIVVFNTASSSQWWYHDIGPIINYLAAGNLLSSQAGDEIICGTLGLANEIYGGDGTNDFSSYLYLLHSQGPAYNGWILQFASDGFYDSSAGIIDINKDGQLDIFASSYSHGAGFWDGDLGRLYAIDPSTRAVILGYSRLFNDYGAGESPVWLGGFADLDNDGNQDILVNKKRDDIGLGYGSVLSLDSITGFPTKQELLVQDCLLEVQFINDINGDGFPEIGLQAIPANGADYRFLLADHHLEVFSEIYVGQPFTSLVSDVDSDGINDLLISGSLYTHVYGMANRSDFSSAIYADFRSTAIYTNNIEIETGPFTGYNNTQGNENYSYRMRMPGESYIKGRFYLENAATDLVLSIRHLTSRITLPNEDGYGYAPIEITVNGYLLVDNYDVAANHDASYDTQKDEFIIPQSFLNSNQFNTIIFEYDAQAVTHYWMQEFRIDIPDSGTIQFASDAYQVKENAGSLKVDILRIGNSEAEMSVPYTVAGQTASNGFDFTGTAGTLNFRKGQVHAFIDIPIHEDAEEEGIETFTISLSEPVGGGKLGTIRTSHISIIDDESPVPVIYVNASAESTGDGTTWPSAFQDLQKAIYKAESPGHDYCEIWVAEGTYIPDFGMGTRLGSFNLLNQVTMLGGFSGHEISADQRRPDLYKTILSGDIEEDDPMAAENNRENSYHVVMAYGVNATAKLDGFIITGGNAVDSFINDGSGGGGIFIDNACPSIANCMITGNSATDGGGVFNYHLSNPAFINCSFVQNKAESTSTTGGGAVSNWLSCPIFINCVFNSNSTSRSGGAFYNWGSSPLLIHCSLVSNYSSMGGAIFNINGVWETHPEIINSVIGYNLADDGSELTLSYDTRLTCSYTNLQRKEDSLYWFRTSQIELDFLNIVDLPFQMTPDLHLVSSSPFINRAPYGIGSDRDEEARNLMENTDMGADEFVDFDNDGLPDWWERRYFSSLTAADPNQDPDSDGIRNMDEYELYGSHPSKGPVYVDLAAQGSLETGTITNPFLTIQKAIDQAQDGDTVLIAPGTYQGNGNTNLDFRGKPIVLRSLQGPLNTVIDCQEANRGFVFQSNETAGSVIEGVTIKKAFAKTGGGIYCINASPQIRGCIFENNHSGGDGSDLYNSRSTITVADCIFRSSEPNGIDINNGNIIVKGTLALVSAKLSGRNMMVFGDGTIQMDAPSILEIHDGRIRCNLLGQGTIYNQVDSELIVEEDSHVDLSGSLTNGKIVCHGLLRVKGRAVVENCNIEVTRASFEDHTIISNSIIMAEAGSPYGQFFVEESVVISGNDIHADGDRYMDMDPKSFEGLIANNRIYVTITEGKYGNQGGLLELRGKADIVSSPCSPGNYLCQLEPNGVPDFSQDTWTIEELVVTENSKVNLTNRFDFGNGDTEEVLYVKKLVLEDGAVLNTAFNQVYYEQMTTSPTASVTNVPLLGFSLKNISFDDETEFITRVRTNNIEGLVLAQRLVGQTMDPSGILRMNNQMVQKPGSPLVGQTIHARAKGHFAKAIEEEITIEFKYQFAENPGGSAELVVYLSDSPLIGDRNLEVARIRPPDVGRPGAINSDQYAVFKGTFRKQYLDFVRGTYVELELRGSQNSECWINDLDPQVYCRDYCRDYDGYGYVDILDYLILLSEYGLANPSLSQRGCLDLCSDDVINMNDIQNWGLEDALNACSSRMLKFLSYQSSPHAGIGTDILGGVPACVISAKPTGTHYNVPDSSLFTFDHLGGLIGSKPFPLEGRLVKDLHDMVYQVDCNAGITAVDTGLRIVDPNVREYQGAIVSVGMKNRYGIPLSDAEFSPADPDVIYVVPVRITPPGQTPYKAAAKLSLTGNGGYSVLQVYGLDPAHDPNQATGPSDTNDISGFLFEPDVQHQTEIETDSMGNIFILSACEINRNNWILVYNESLGTASEKRFLLSEPNLVGPIEMQISPTRQELYLSCSSSPSVDPNLLETKIYRYSITYEGTEVLNILPISSIPVICPFPEFCNSMPQYCQEDNGYRCAVTSMSLDDSGRFLYITGLSMPRLERSLVFGDSTVNSFFNTAFMAVADIDQSVSVSAVSISDYGVALPVSIMPISTVWVFCKKADINSSGTVDIEDLSILVDQWLQAPGIPSADISPAPDGDDTVNLQDFELFAQCWLTIVRMN